MLNKIKNLFKKPKEQSKPIAWITCDHQNDKYYHYRSENAFYSTCSNCLKEILAKSKFVEIL